MNTATVKIENIRACLQSADPDRITTALLEWSALASLHRKLENELLDEIQNACRHELEITPAGLVKCLRCNKTTGLLHNLSPEEEKEIRRAMSERAMSRERRTPARQIKKINQEQENENRN